jgi:hypothetical protein
VANLRAKFYRLSDRQTQSDSIFKILDVASSANRRLLLQQTNKIKQQHDCVDQYQRQAVAAASSSATTRAPSSNPQNE